MVFPICFADWSKDASAHDYLNRLFLSAAIEEAACLGWPPFAG
jgi:hypothetical protein